MCTAIYHIRSGSLTCMLIWRCLYQFNAETVNYLNLTLKQLRFSFKLITYFSLTSMLYFILKTLYIYLYLYVI